MRASRRSSAAISSACSPKCGRDAMTRRRDFLQLAALSALAPMLRAHAAEAAPVWPRYRDVIAIDGEGGLDLLREDGGDEKAVARELAETRASGLSAVLLQVTNVRSNFDTAVSDLMRVRARADVHPDAFLVVRTRADLDRAHREKKLGLILRFQ